MSMHPATRGLILGLFLGTVGLLLALIISHYQVYVDMFPEVGVALVALTLVIAVWVIEPTGHDSNDDQEPD